MSPAGRGPVLITGLDHGGKTPLRIALDAHPSLALMRRAYLWTHFDGRFGPLDDASNLAACIAALAGHGPIARLGLDLGAIADELRRGETGYDRLFALIGEAHARSRGRARWGIQESGLERHADRLLAADPETRILHAVRDPRDWYARVRADGGRRGGVGVATATWLASTRLGLRNAARHPDRCRLVRAEDLARDPASVLDELLGFLGEASAPSTVESAVALRLAQRGAGDLPPALRAFIEAEAGEVMARLGYHGAVDLAWRQRLRYRVLIRPFGRLTGIAWRASERWAPGAAELLRGRPTMKKVRLHDAT